MAEKTVKGRDFRESESGFSGVDESGNREWLVADRHGAFAMGTREGLRTRKYHGFYQTIPGRSETSFLTDFDLWVNGQPLWPHQYGGGVIQPRPECGFRLEGEGPCWHWVLPQGALTFSVSARARGGIELRFRFEGDSPIRYLFRPLAAMRTLHGIGGNEWTYEGVGAASEVPATRARIASPSTGSEFYLLFAGPGAWRNEPLWYRHFEYPVERERGYDFTEDLYSAGCFEGELGDGEFFKLVLAENPDALSFEPASWQAPISRSPALDFSLMDPPGIVAGFPWFGEWGRDTFVSLPGIVCAWLDSGGDPAEVGDWTVEILKRWGMWITTAGMLPNLIEAEGEHQWESADATLWWCHALASLWAFSLTGLLPAIAWDQEFGATLDAAIRSITEGRHLFLRLNAEGLLEVTEPHSTWMDARIGGAAITPRSGVLPEINALWFQAKTLHDLWGRSAQSAPWSDREAFARRVLAVRESERSNTVFLHSLPLAPSFVVGDPESLSKESRRLRAAFWTPYGLRTLDPKNWNYQPRCVGDQGERDRAYHQGPVWGWLGGHFEMMKDRLPEDERESMPEMLGPDEKSRQPIQGHIAEIFDAEEPFTPRGAPAQAWSVACLAEAKARRKHQVDQKLTEILALRWKGREDRRATGRGRRPAGRRRAQ